MKKVALPLALLVAALALAACGAEQTDSVDSVVDIEAAPDPARVYTEDHEEATAGKIEVHFTNAPEPAGEPQEPYGYLHGVVIDGPNGKAIAQTEQINDGSTSITVNLKPGVYPYHCVLYYRTMKGTLKVVDGDASE